MEKIDKRRPKMAIETGYTYSEFDENYYYMAVTDELSEFDEKGKYKKNTDNKNPDLTLVGRYDDPKLLCQPMTTKKVKAIYLDFMLAPLSKFRLLVSERVKEQLDDIFQTIDELDDRNTRPVFWSKQYIVKQRYEEFGDPCVYYALHFPRYKFIDLAQIPEIKEHHHGEIKSFGDLKYIVLDARAIKAVPEEKRQVFSMDWIKLFWKFCTKDIKDKIESTGATGIKFIKSRDKNFEMEFKERTHEYYG
jgi:hypothetical protein